MLSLNSYFPEKSGFSPPYILHITRIYIDTILEEGFKKILKIKAYFKNFSVLAIEILKLKEKLSKAL
jgi:hypothetical protein